MCKISAISERVTLGPLVELVWNDSRITMYLPLKIFTKPVPEKPIITIRL